MMITAINSIISLEDHSGASDSVYQTFFEAVSIMMLWFQLFVYLSAFNKTNYLTRMIREVFQQIQVFFLIYMIFHLGFAELFFYISSSSSEGKFVETYIDAIIYSFVTALGEYDLSFMEDGN
jgi:hypothetical protein